MKAACLISIACLAMLVGCVTTPTCVREDVGWWKRTFSAPSGIPYYLPRPYLMVTKNFVLTTKTETKTTVKTPDGGKNPETNVVVETTTPTTLSEVGDTYSCEIVYLPDIKQKYLLKFNRGAGTQENSFTLQDGWKLTGVNSKADAKTPETITAVASVLKEIGSLVSPTKKALGFADPKDNEKLIKAMKDKQAGVWFYDLGDIMSNKKAIRVWDSTRE